MNQTIVRDPRSLVALGETGQPYLAQLKSKGVLDPSVNVKRSLRAVLMEYFSASGESSPELMLAIAGLTKNHPRLSFGRQNDVVFFGYAPEFEDQIVDLCMIDIYCVKVMLSVGHYDLSFIGLGRHARDLAHFLIKRFGTVSIVSSLAHAMEACGDLSRSLPIGTSDVKVLTSQIIDVVGPNFTALTDDELFNYLSEDAQ